MNISILEGANSFHISLVKLNVYEYSALYMNTLNNLRTFQS
jgi:hypothetical protein